MLKPEAEAGEKRKKGGGFIKKYLTGAKESGLEDRNRKNIKQIDSLLEKWYNI